MKKPIYEIKNLKTFRGMDTGGYNCSLYRDGKKVADVIDDGSGGNIMIHWGDASSQRVEITTKNFYEKSKTVTYKGTPEEKILVEFVATLPDLEDPQFGKLTMNPELFIANLVQDFENKKNTEKFYRSLDKGRAKETYFRLKGDAKNSYRVLKAPYTDPRVKAKLEKDYGDKVIEVYGEYNLENA